MEKLFLSALLHFDHLIQCLTHEPQNGYFEEQPKIVGPHVKRAIISPFLLDVDI